MKHARTDANYPILTKRAKLKHEKKPISNLKSIESVSLEQTYTKFIEIFVPQEEFLYRKNTAVENILVTITDSSDVCCFHLYLINIFTKPTKAGRCTDIMFKLKLYCLSVTVEDPNL